MHAQRLESIGTLTSGIAHDFNNYLTIINCAAEVRLIELPSCESAERETLESIHDAGRRAANLTNQLLAFSRKSAMEASSLNLNVVVEGLSNLIERLVGLNIKLVMNLDSKEGFIHSDPVHIEQILLNLAVNARDAMMEKGILRISTGRRVLDADEISIHRDAKPGPYLSLTVSDNGEGMSEETKARVFEPFFTTKAIGKGTGLGLSTVYGIVKQNHGLIRLQSALGKGTTFEILFPETDPDGTAIPAPRLPATPESKTIVLADDNISLRDITKMVLETRGFTVLESSHAREALAHVEKNKSKIDLILSDITMPGMNSSDFIEAIEKIQPGIPILFMSGNSNHTFLHRYQTRTGLPFLQKPFTTQTLNNKLNEALERSRKRST